MPLLTAAVVLFGAVSILDLILLLGVIRRLRDHAERLSGGAAANLDPGTLGLGERIGSFTATTPTGRLLTREAPPGYRLVGFVKPACGPCEEQLPDFVEVAAHAHTEGVDVIAVVVGTPEEARPMLPRLAGVPTVTVEPLDGELCAAFRAYGFPTYYLIDEEGTIRGVDHRAGALAALVPARQRT